MEFAILAACGVIIVLLVLLLARSGKDGGQEGELRREIALVRETLDGESRRLLDQMSRQDGTTVTQFAALGKDLRESQELQGKNSSDRLAALEGEFARIRAEILDALEKIRVDNAASLEKVRADNAAGLEKLRLENQSSLTRISETVNNRLAALEGEFARIRTEILDALEKVRADNSASLEKVRADNAAGLEKVRLETRSSLDSINETVNEKLQKTLDERISRSYELVNQRLAQVYEGLGEMKNVASGVSDLKNVLSNVKSRGILGEIQLSAILDDILAPEQYETQFRLNPRSTEMVDFAVRLPGLEEGEYVYLPIDSKFPGDTYASLAAAYDSGGPDELKARRAALEQEIKRCAKSIHDKYIVPPYSTDFAILFLPFEGLYAEVVNMGLVEVLQREYRVNITGPSTMAAMLNSLQMGFRTLAIQKKSGEVWKILEAAKKEFATFEEGLSRTRSRLRQADDELEKLIGTRTRAINRKLRTVSSLEESEDSAQLLELS